MSQLTTFTGLAPGDQFAFVETVPAVTASAAVTAISLNMVAVARVRVQNAILISTMTVYIGTASGNIGLGIYTGTLSGGLTRVAATANTAAAGSNALQAIALSTAYTLIPATDYWFAVGADNTSVTFGRANSGVVTALTADATARAAAKASAYSSGLPTSLASLAATGNIFWIMGS